MKTGRVVINYSMCDNAPECSGIAVCPTGALYFDEEKNKIAFNADLCCDCGACADAEGEGCPVGAIMHADSDEEYEKLLAEAEADMDKVEALNVERYGATPIDAPIELANLSQFIGKNSNGKMLVELYCDDSIHCLLHSIPISGLKDELNGFKYTKVHVNDLTELQTIAEIQEFTKDIELVEDLPILIAFNNGIPIGRTIGAYYDDTERDKLVDELKKLFNM